MKAKALVKPELAQSCLDLAVELTRGAELFDKFGQPTEALLRYTGDRVIQDEERCLWVGALRLLEMSDRKIAEVIGCDTRSIPLMLRAAEKSGRIPALKERLTQLTGTNAERAQIALGALLNRAAEGKGDMDLAAMIKAVSTAGGINTQNLQLLTGGPTEILELKVGAGRQEIEDWARSLAIPVDATVTAPSDLESTGNSSKPLQMQGSAAAGYDRDTAATSPDPCPAVEPPRTTGGGDAPKTPGAGRTDGSTGF